MEINFTTIASIVGAAAWIPITFKPICNFFRHVHITPLDLRVLTEASATSAYNKEKKHGTIILLALNLYIKEVPLFAQKISASVILKNGTKLKTELLDFSTLTTNNDDNTKSIYQVPISQELNITRSIHPYVDNIKYVSFLVENADFRKPEDINMIKLCLGSNKWWMTKKINISYCELPKFNSTHMLNACEKVINQ